MNRYKTILIIIISVIISFSFLMILSINSRVNTSEKFFKSMIKKEAIIYFNNITNSKKLNLTHKGVFVKLKDNNISIDKKDKLVNFNSMSFNKSSDISNKANNTYFKITSLHPLNPKNKPDKFEKKVLEYLEKNKMQQFYSEISKDKKTYNFMGALITKKSCLKCHINSFNKLGEIQGGVRISIPIKVYNDQIMKLKDESKIIIFLVLLISVLLIFLFIKFIKKLEENHLKLNKNLEEIKKLEKSNSELIMRFEFAMEATKDGLWDWNLKTNEVYFSNTWKTMLGYEDYELKNDLEEWNIRVHPEDKEKALESISANIKGETKVYKNIHRLKHKNGSWVWILDRGKTYYNEDNEAYRMVGFHSDITEMKNLEINLQKTKEELLQLRVVIESAPISIIITDIDSNIIYVNSYFCISSGYEKDEIIGKNPRFLRYEEEKNQEGDKFLDLQKTIKEGNTWNGIFKNRKKDGSIYWVSSTISPTKNKNGEITNFLGIMREITKEVYLENQLKEKEELMLLQSKNAAMGEMISMIAHQWRQPITAISMSANNILVDLELEELDFNQLKQTAENISEQTQFLSKTIDDFRNFFKNDKKPENVEVHKLISELNTIILASLKNHDIKFNTYYEESVKINTYKRELLQILLNLVKNAKEAFPNDFNKTKIINMYIKKIDKSIEIKVQDNAGGIEDKYIDKIFDAYFTTKSECNGTGLGLYMSRMIVQKHLKGSLNCFNDEEGANFLLKFNSF